MKCFMCDKPVVPEKGYFRTQLWGNKICHVDCKPKFYHDNKPEEDFEQTLLFPILDQEVKSEATTTQAT